MGHGERYFIRPIAAFLFSRIMQGMRIIADFHIHSPYSRAVSKEMTLENLDQWAGLKGITVMGTGDFTHPAWIKEIKKKLEPAETGLYVLKSQIPSTKLQTNSKFQIRNSQTRFLLTVEISSIYSKGGKTRRIHNLIFAPSVETAEKINAALGWQGNLKSDGRPILGLDAKELAKIVLNIDSRCLIVPCHAWTPWFSIFGSMSGFDSIEECFDEYAKHIYAIETGLSSDPAMNWMVPSLDDISIISNSDCHSPEKIMREANVFDCELRYDAIYEALKNKSSKKLLYTIEFFPEEGKYHYDGHRACDFATPPERTKELRGICPRCGRPLTVGVLNRVGELAKRPYGQKPPHAIPFKNLIPLDEIIAQVKGTLPNSKIVQRQYHALIEAFGNELVIIEDILYADLAKVAGMDLAKAVVDVREGRVKLTPGYDGAYGKIELLGGKQIERQAKLF